MNVSNLHTLDKPIEHTAGVEHVGIQSNGAVVYWKTADTSRYALRQALQAVNLEDLLPGQREPFALLKSALLRLANEHSNGDRKVIVLDRKNPKVQGYEIHVSFKQEGQANVVTHYGSYVVDEHGLITVSGGTYGAAFFEDDQVRAAYDYQLGIVTGAAVGRILVRAVERNGGVCLRPAGGVYWVPEDAGSLDTIKRVAQALAAANEKSKVYVLHTVLDEHAIDAVKDALVEEVTGIAFDLRQELKENQLGKRAVETRQVHAKDLHDRVSRYESILGEALTSLHEAVAVAEQELAATRALADVEAFGSLYGVTE